MQFLHNKILIGVLCVVVGLAVGFVVIPKVDSANNAKINVVRATRDIQKDTLIDESMLEVVPVTASQVNLEASRIEDFAGFHAASKIYKGDYLTNEKLNLFMLDPVTSATANNKLIVSVTVPSLAASTSGILQQGDVVMLMVSGVNPDDYSDAPSTQVGVNNTVGDSNTLHYNTETNQFYYENSDTEVLGTNTLMTSTVALDEMVIIDEIKYLEVCSIAASDGSTSVVNSEVQEGESNSLPYTISFFCTEKQALLLAQIEQEGEFHVAFVARGDDADAYIPAKDRVLSHKSASTIPGADDAGDLDSGYGISTIPATTESIDGSIGE